MMSEPEPTRSAATVEFGRTELQPLPSPIAGSESVQFLAEIPGDVASGCHPGPEVGYIVRGDVAIEFDEGAIPTLRRGDPFLIPPGLIHNARNIGSVTTNDAFHLCGIRGATLRDRLQLKARFRDSGWTTPFLWYAVGRHTTRSREDTVCLAASSGRDGRSDHQRRSQW